MEFEQLDVLSRLLVHIPTRPTRHTRPTTPTLRTIRTQPRTPRITRILATTHTHRTFLPTTHCSVLPVCPV